MIEPLARLQDEATSIWRDAQALAHDGGPPKRSAAGSADDASLAWYAGLGTMAAVGLIEWNLAGVLALAHTVERYSHRKRLEAFVEGADAGV